MVGKFSINVTGGGNATEETVNLVQEYPIFSLTNTDNQKAFNEKVAFAIEQLMPSPTYIAPAVALGTIPAIAEIGATMGVSLNATFTKNDAGNITRLEVLKGAVSLVNNAANSLAHTDNITVPNAVLSYTAKATYAQGAVKQNSLGIDVPNGRIAAGSITSAARLLKGVYPVFFGVIEPTQTIDNVSVSNLTKLIVDSSADVSCAFNFVGKRMVIAIPKSSANKTAWFVTELNKGTIGNAGDLFAAPAVKTYTSPHNLWQNVEYNVYISTPTNLNGTMQLRNS